MRCCTFIDQEAAKISEVKVGAKKKNHQLGQIQDHRARGPADWADFLSTSNFDLWYFCGPSTKSNVQYLIWKIYFISVWSQKPKVIAANLDYENLSQKTLISYHKWVFVLEWLSLAVCWSNSCLIYLTNSWPAWLMLGMESHSRDLGMNSHSFLLKM